MRIFGTRKILVIHTTSATSKMHHWSTNSIGVSTSVYELKNCTLNTINSFKGYILVQKRFGGLEDADVVVLSLATAPTSPAEAVAGDATTWMTRFATTCCRMCSPTPARLTLGVGSSGRPALELPVSIHTGCRLRVLPCRS